MHPLLNIATVIKSRKTTLALITGTQTEMCIGFGGKHKTKRTLARPSGRWEVIKMECKGTGCESVV